MPQPPFQFAQQPGENDHQHQVDGRRADEGEHLLIGPVVDALGGIQQLLAADDGDEGGVLQQDDELVAQGGEDGLHRLGHNDKAHGGAVAQAQGPAGLHLPLVHRHQAAPDDLRHIGPGVDAQGQGADHGEVPAAGEDDKAHDEQLDHHRGAPDDGDVDLTDQVQHRQDGVAVAGALLVVGGAEDGHRDPQGDAQNQGQGGDQEGGFHPVEVLQPAVGLDECLVELHEEVLKEAQVPAGDTNRLPGVV